MIKHIKDYIAERIDSGETTTEIATDLGVSVGMISSYKTSYNASMAVAKTVYAKYKIALHPFSAESLKFELRKKK